jgi:hypothetical protein
MAATADRDGELTTRHLDHIGATVSESRDPGRKARGRARARDGDGDGGDGDGGLEPGELEQGERFVFADLLTQRWAGSPPPTAEHYRIALRQWKALGTVVTSATELGAAEVSGEAEAPA